MKNGVNIILVLIVAFASITCTSNSKSNKIEILNRKILVDKQPYIIKGICYHPVPQGSDKRNFVNIDHDLGLMKEAGINTIRVYSPINEEFVLDKISNAGIKVIIGFGYNQGGYYDILSGSFMDYVNKYKNHDAILLWELGNEYNYHPEWFDGDINNWYMALNNAAKKIHETDSIHLVATAHGELPDSLSLAICENIDVWGMNVYRWDNPEDIFAQWKDISTKPMYLSEAGADSYMTVATKKYEKGENQKAQADAVSGIIDKTFQYQNICSGITLFSFTDGWWKAGDNNTQDVGGWAPNSIGVPYDGAPNEEYWGIVDINRNKKDAFEIVKQKYNTINIK